MFTLLLVLVLCCFGLLVPFWGCYAVALALLIFEGYVVLSITLAVGVDLLFGPPVGIFHIVFAPFTCMTILALSIRFFFVLNLRDRSTMAL